MSDGDNATPGRRIGSDGDEFGSAANPWLTRTPRPSIGAAPWERSTVSSSTPNQPVDAPSGNHTDGVSVADLIAKMGGVAGNGRRTTRHRVDDEPGELHDDSAPQDPSPHPSRS